MSLLLQKPNKQGAIDTSVWYVPVVSGAGYNSDFVAFTTSTAFTGIGAAMVPGKFYIFTATAACWICQSAAGTAAAKAAGSFYVPFGIHFLIDGAQGGKLTVLQDSTGGNASLVEATA